MPVSDDRRLPNGNAEGLKRRTLMNGAAWAAPVVTLAAAAPAMAASLRIDPGINGWVSNSPVSRGGCDWTLEVNSAPSATPVTPDGAPFGLYLYDVQPTAVISNASLTYWIIGDHRSSNAVTWTAASGHSACWVGPTTVGTQTKPDGLVYTGYRWTYNCTITPSQVASDGRLRLGTFHVTASFTQPSTLCSDVTYWTQRTITVDQDGAGSQAAKVLTFQRRNGTRGAYTAPAARSAALAVSASQVS